MLIGITGGVGAGKSTVMHLLSQEYDTYTILADDVARDLQKKGMPIYQAIVNWLGEEILNADGELDRNKMAKLIFSDQEKLTYLNALVHPQVRQKILSLIAQNQDRYTHVAVEAALLIEEQYDEILDELWFIDASDEVRIQRLIASRGYSEAKCRDIMSKQLSRTHFMDGCNRVIDNSLDETHLKEEIDRAFRQISE